MFRRDFRVVYVREFNQFLDETLVNPIILVDQNLTDGFVDVKSLDILLWRGDQTPREIYEFFFKKDSFCLLVLWDHQDRIEQRAVLTESIE